MCVSGLPCVTASLRFSLELLDFQVRVLSADRAQVGAGLPCLLVFGCVCERLSAEGSPWWPSWAGAG